MGYPRPLFRLFSSFQTNISILTKNICEILLCPSSIRRLDSNPRPSEHESPPITTRPGLPPIGPLFIPSFDHTEVKQNIANENMGGAAHVFILNDGRPTTCTRLTAIQLSTLTTTLTTTSGDSGFLNSVTRCRYKK